MEALLLWGAPICRPDPSRCADEVCARAGGRDGSIEPRGLLEVCFVNHQSVLTLHCVGQETEAPRCLVTHTSDWTKKVVMKLVAIYLNFQSCFKAPFCFYYKEKHLFFRAGVSKLWPVFVQPLELRMVLTFSKGFFFFFKATKTTKEQRI